MVENKPFSERTMVEAKVGIKEMLELGKRIEKTGEKVIFLAQGEPNFDTPQHIKEAAWEALKKGYTHYVTVEGLKELREAIAEKLYNDSGLTVDPESEVIVTNGAKLGLFIAVMALIGTGDEVLLPDPSFGSYSEIINIAGGKAIFISCKEEEGRFVLRAEEMAKKTTERTKAIIINTPDNPTGTVYTREELSDIADFAKRYNLYIIVDEVYEKFIYDGHQHCSLASLSEDAKARTVLVNSFSKTYAMTGWRLGYTVSNKNLQKAMAHISQNSGRCATAFVQKAGVAALRGPQESVQDMISEYKARRDLIVTGLNKVNGIRCNPPEGTFYAFPDISQFGMDSSEFSRYLAERCGVIVTPGSYFGSKGEGYVRLSYSASRENIEEGVYRIKKCISKIT